MSNNNRSKPEKLHPSQNSLLYAVYSSEGGKSYLAVCLDDPFCFGSGSSRDIAVTRLLKQVELRYGDANELDDIIVPEYMPEDF